MVFTSSWPRSKMHRHLQRERVGCPPAHQAGEVNHAAGLLAEERIPPSNCGVVGNMCLAFFGQCPPYHKKKAPNGLGPPGAFRRGKKLHVQLRCMPRFLRPPASRSSEKPCRAARFHAVFVKSVQHYWAKCNQVFTLILVSRAIALRSLVRLK